jgi:hypothetical protein
MLAGPISPPPDDAGGAGGEGSGGEAAAQEGTTIDTAHQGIHLRGVAGQRKPAGAADRDMTSGPPRGMQRRQ